jgi:hypothetical protein
MMRSLGETRAAGWRWTAPAIVTLLWFLLLDGAVLAGSEAARAITLTASKDKLTYGDEVVLSGQVQASTGAPQGCVSDVEVMIRYDEDDDVDGAWQEAARVRTGADGAFAATIRPRGSADFVAWVRDDPPGCGESSSGSVTVRVRRRVTLAAQDTTLRPGEVANLRVLVEPECEAFLRPIQLRQRIHGRFVRVAAKEPDASCVVHFGRRLWKDAVFLGRARRGSPGGLGVFYMTGESAPQRIEVS